MSGANCTAFMQSPITAREFDGAYRCARRTLRFLLGGSATSAHLHFPRTLARRAERLMCALAESEAVNPAAEGLGRNTPAAIPTHAGYTY